MSVKDAYGIAPSQDTALALENQMLALGASDRVGVVQKITQIDPRRMKIARYIETFSIDELPQLWNVFI
jgi:lipopolysaccharide/colanic/teichoic acid biosynthesis glycosyltransferase